MSVSQRLELTKAPVFLMDGSAFIYRGYFANRGLSRSDGFPTNSLYSLMRLLLKILREEKPEHFLFVRDGKGQNFRHELYPLYKANREAMPEDLAIQIEPIGRMVRALGLPSHVTSGYEADDCLASLAARLSPLRPVIIVSGDKDLKQCLGPNVFLWDPASKEEKLLTAESFAAESQVPPALWADAQALIGDTSDNIPGVPGIGPKAAAKILAICPGLEAVRDDFDKQPPRLPPKMREKLAEHLEAMFLWRKLTTLALDRCPDPAAIVRPAGLEGEAGEQARVDHSANGLAPEEMLACLAVLPADRKACLDLTREFEMNQLARDLAALFGNSAETGTDSQTAGQATNKGRTSKAREPRRTGLLDLVGKDGQKAGNGEGQPGQTDPAFASHPDFADCASTASLPEPEDLRVAIVWPDGAQMPLHLAFASSSESGGGGAREYCWTGKLDDLVIWLARAGELVVSDAKQLLLAAPVWKRLLSPALAGGRQRRGPLVRDLGLMAWLLYPGENDYSWQHLSVRFAQPAMPAPSLTSLAGEAAPADVGRNGPASQALALAANFGQRLAKDGLEELYQSLELPLVSVLAGMEQAGIAIDQPAFATFLADVQKELDSLTAEIYKQAGKPFNLRSAQQLGTILFEQLGLGASGRGPKKTRGGQFSTSQEVLEGLVGKHPIIDNILQFRKLEKMRSTYLEPLPRLVDGEGRLHTTFNQKGTATGRLSSVNPNLQNIPVRGDLGKRMRTCFVARPGHVLLSADYSQVELRVLAHISQDSALLAAFHAGEDIHARTAALVHEIGIVEVTPEQRRDAKTVNFGLVYGMGAQSLGRELGITTAQAKDFIARYFARLTGLERFYAEVETQARKDGLVSTLAGRQRQLPDIHSQNNQAYSQARRQAINTVIQGSAADIIKLAMLAVASDPTLNGLGARLVLQIHDELLLEVPEGNARTAGERVASLMASVQPGGKPLSLPLVVDWGIGASWGEAH